MRRSRNLLVGIVALISFAGGAGRVSIISTEAQQPLGPRESRGKQIYTQGTSPAGKEILAYIGDLEVPGSTMPCASCHGLSGQGPAEGGVSPSNITWEALTKPYGLTHATGRKHPPYTTRAVELALTRGLDPAGNKLLAVMPRYTMSREDMADLILYLALVGKDLDPGLTDSAIIIGTVLPAKGALAEVGQAIKAVTFGVFEDANAAGGIYNRRLELKVAETGDNPAASRRSFETLHTATPVFASTNAFVAGAEKELLSLFNQKEIPLVAPFTLYPAGDAKDRRTFYLLSGIDDQLRALVEYGGKIPEIKKGGIAIVSNGGERNAAAFDALKRQSLKAGLPEPLSISYDSGSFDSVAIVKQAKATGREAISLLGTASEAFSFMKEAERTGWFPFVFLSSAVAAGDILNAPVGFDRRVFMGFPISPAAQSVEGIKEFRAFAVRHQLTSKHVASQIQAYAAARLLIEGLKRTGKDLSRERLVRALEGLNEYQTGLTPPITFGPNRRIGALGAYVITIDLKEKKFVQVGGWVGLDGK